MNRAGKKNFRVLLRELCDLLEEDGFSEDFLKVLRKGLDEGKEKTK